MSAPVKVFMEGSPGDSLWLAPSETWDQICRGEITDFSGLFISVSTARRLLDETIVAGPKSEDWHGSEGGTPRRLEGVEDNTVITVSYRLDEEERDHQQETLSHSVRSTDTYNQ